MRERERERIRERIRERERERERDEDVWRYCNRLSEAFFRPKAAALAGAVRSSASDEAIAGKGLITLQQT